MTEASATRAAIDAVWRAESARVIARLARMLGDIGAAEEVAQDALVDALESWPSAGIPRNPGAWLVTAGKHRALDRLRRNQLAARKHQAIAAEPREPTVDEDAAGELGDDLLRLAFIACHPILSMEARVALSLRLLGGLGTAEIARAFLVSEVTIAQRIVRAKRTLGDAGVPFELPPPDDLVDRAAGVMEVIYLVFNEGYSATAGEDLLRPALCQDAIRLGRMLAQVLAAEPEVHALVALMELQASRAGARVAADGTPVPLLEQDRTRWDPLLVRRGLAALARARFQGGHGPYTLQAEIAACHARATAAADTDWRRIATLYAELGALTPSPVVEVNRAMAVGMVEGPAMGLAILDGLVTDARLAGYAPLFGVRAELLRRLGRSDEAHDTFLRAAELTRNERERAVLLGHAAACREARPPRAG